MTRIAPLMGQNFIEYASYVIVDRAIPDIRDGLKPVQRRILATLSKMDDGKFHKVANVIGDTMKLHPHGDASIGDALVVLANKDYFIERQGNFEEAFKAIEEAALSDEDRRPRSAKPPQPSRSACSSCVFSGSFGESQNTNQTLRDDPGAN